MKSECMAQRTVAQNSNPNKRPFKLFLQMTEIE